MSNFHICVTRQFMIFCSGTFFKAHLSNLTLIFNSKSIFKEHTHPFVMRHVSLLFKTLAIYVYLFFKSMHQACGLDRNADRLHVLSI